MADTLIDQIVQAVAELPDRTSPDDWPEAMLVTSDELRAILAAALASPGVPAGQENSPQDALLRPVHQVYFRAGLIACREYMARFVEAQDPTTAMSIRANWWPSLGPDFGPPRQMDWNEVMDGDRCRRADEVSPTQEALPIALEFLQLCASGSDSTQSAAPSAGPAKEPICHGPMRLIHQLSRCDTCGALDELSGTQHIRAASAGPAREGGVMSQSIASDRISESTIARIAGNLLSGVIAQSESSWEAIPPEAVRYAVKAARAIAAEIERTRPTREER